MTSCELKKVGYWRDPNDASTSSLPTPHDLVDEEWDPAERALVVEHLKAGGVHEVWQGYSWCRFRCGIPDAQLGVFDLTDGEWVWPAGFVHYVEVHAVKPPEAFLEHVRRVRAGGEKTDEAPPRGTSTAQD